MGESMVEYRVEDNKTVVIEYEDDWEVNEIMVRITDMCKFIASKLKGSYKDPFDNLYLCPCGFARIIHEPKEKKLYIHAPKCTEKWF